MQKPIDSAGDLARLASVNGASLLAQHGHCLGLSGTPGLLIKGASRVTEMHN
jgi:hypothetical protein